MKKKLFLLFCLFNFKSTFAQVSDSSILPLPWDIVNTMNCDTTGVVIGSTGTNQIFDYSGLVNIVQQNFQYLPADTINGYNDFPTATMKRSFSNLNFSFFKRTTDTLYTLGSYDNSTTSPHWSVKYPNGFPLISSGIIFDSLYIDSIPLVYYNETHSHKVVLKTIMDATGTLRLPTGDIPNVYRIKRTYTEYSNGVPNPGQYSFGYGFYAAGTRAPWLTISYSKYNSNSPLYINVDYLESITAIKKEHIGNLVSIFPNPFSEEININIAGIKDEKKICIVNALAQIVTQKNTNEEFLNINTVALNPGVYFVKIILKEKILTGKIVKSVD